MTETKEYYNMVYMKYLIILVLLLSFSILACSLKPAVQEENQRVARPVTQPTPPAAFDPGSITQEQYESTKINAARVHAPIGINIKSETPAEIAVSIAGELILIRAQGAQG